MESQPVFQAETQAKFFFSIELGPWHQSSCAVSCFFLASCIEVDVILVRRLGQSMLGIASDITEVAAAVDGLNCSKDTMAHQLKGSGDGVSFLFRQAIVRSAVTLNIS